MKRISGLSLLLLSACAQLPPSQPVIDTPVTVPEAETVVTTRPQLTAELQQQFTAAKQLLLDKDYPAALSQFNQLSKQAPEAGGIWYNLALAQWYSGQTDAAQLSLQQAVDVAPQHSDSHNLLGVLARQRGDMRAAERHFKQALAGSEPYAMAHKNLAFLYELYLGLPLQAHYHYQQYYQLTQDEQVKLWLALLEQELDSQHLTDSAVPAATLQENGND